MPSRPEARGRLFVVAHSSTLAEALVGAGYEVQTAQADEARAWVRELSPEMALLIQSADLSWVVETVALVRSAGLAVPVMTFVSGAEPRDRLAADCADDEKVTVFGLPLSYDRLLDAVEQAVEHDAAARAASAPAPAQPPAPGLPPAPDPTPTATPTATPTPTATAAQPPAAAQPPPRYRDARGGGLPAGALVAEAAAVAAAAGAGAAGPGTPGADPAAGADRTGTGTAGAGGTSGTAGTAEGGNGQAARRRRFWSPSAGAGTGRARGSSWPTLGENRLAVSLVRRLLPILDQLESVNLVAGALVGTAVDATKAEAGVLLLLDDGAWRVQAGSGLRPVEYRRTLPPTHWLVSQVVGGRTGLLVEDTDIARVRLQGAPLASWQHLLAVPVVEAEGILLVARAAAPFTPPDLTAAVEISRSGGALLREAADTRELARRLEPFVERVSAPPSETG